MSKDGTCDKCSKKFSYTLFHSGFGESSYAYCNKCGKVALLDTYLVPPKIKYIFLNYARHHIISKELEKFIDPCECGGKFTHNASPRCPHCKQKLSAIEANKYIESDNPNKKEAWLWQNNWTGLYAMIIDDNKINDNWKLYPPKLTLKEKIKFALDKFRKKKSN